jgi:hypothetical protein
MSTRRSLQVVLLVVVASTLAVVFWPRQPHSSSPAVQLSTQPGISYAAVYFHGNIRCETCRSIEAQAKDAIKSGFDNELATGRLQWGAVNFELPQNEHFQKEFELTHSTLVLIEREGGQTKRFEALDRVWELVQDKNEFQNYVQNELADWMRSGT